MQKLNSGGYLAILVPAHQKLYTKFDKAVGHYKRYEHDFFQKNKFHNAELVLYFVNQFVFREEIYPSRFKIFIWDKLFTPISILMDFLLRYKFGKNIMCILKKK